MGSSTYNGQNDQLTPAEAEAAGTSLALVQVEQLTLKVFQPGLAFGNTKRRIQGRFAWAGNTYWLWVTDPVIERAYLRGDDGDYSLGRHFLTISVGEVHNGQCYKLIAGVIEDKV